MSETMEVKDDGHNVVDRVPLNEWIDLQSDHVVGEYIHLVYDEDLRELRCYFSVEPENSDENLNARVKTTISGVDMAKTTADKRNVNIKSFFLTWTEAMNFMAFSELFSITNNGHGMSIRWSESDGGKMMDDEDTSMEALTFRFTNQKDMEKTFQIRSEWQVPTHKMANIEGEGY